MCYIHTYTHTHTYISFVHQRALDVTMFLFAGAGDQFVSGAFGRGGTQFNVEVAASPQWVSVSSFNGLD